MTRLSRHARPAGRLIASLGALLATVAILGSSGLVAPAAAAEEAPVIRILAPLGDDTYPIGHALPVAWRADAVDSGEFGLWVQDLAGVRYGESTIASKYGGRIRANYVYLKVPAAARYRVGMGWRPTVGSGTWLGVELSGTFQVGTPAPSPTPTPVGPPAITVANPAGSGTYVENSKLEITWTSTPVYTGEFGAWAESATGERYALAIVPAKGTSFKAMVAFTMPEAAGYRLVVAWRSTVGLGDWKGTAKSPGTFEVVGGGPGDGPAVMVLAPVGTATHETGASITVRWRTAWNVSAGEFGVWVSRAGYHPYLETMVAPDGGSSYSHQLRLSLPAGTGYRAVVGWRHEVGRGEWRSVDESPGSFAITGAPDPRNAFKTFDLEGLWPAVHGVIDEGYHTVTLTVPARTDVRALVATFTVCGRCTVMVGGKEQVSGTTPNDFTGPVTYVIDADEWDQQAWVVTVKPEGPVVGDKYGGGIVAYIYQPGDPGYMPGETHGIIAAEADQGVIPWALPSWQNKPVGTTGTALGTGAANTDAIIAQNNRKASGYAAALARSYAGGGFTDWYLPSKDELHKLCLNQAKIGGFVPFAAGDAGEYWSSSEESRLRVWVEAIERRVQSVKLKSGDDVGGPGHVRAIRRF